MANQLESSGLPGRVHVSKATANCLDGAYELEPVRKSSDHSDPKSFLIRPSQVMQKTASESNEDSSKQIDEARDENAESEWKPEIPFINLNKANDDFKSSGDTNSSSVNEERDSNRTLRQAGPKWTDRSARLNLGKTFRRSNTSRDSNRDPQDSGTSSLGFYRSFNVKSSRNKNSSANATGASFNRTQHSVGPTMSRLHENSSKQRRRAKLGQLLRSSKEVRDETSQCNSAVCIEMAGEVRSLKQKPPPPSLASSPLSRESGETERNSSTGTQDDQKFGSLVVSSKQSIGSRVSAGSSKVEGSDRKGGSSGQVSRLFGRREQRRDSKVSAEANEKSLVVWPHLSSSGKSRREISEGSSKDRRQAREKSIEVEISRRMFKEHIDWLRLMFNDQDLEKAYCRIRNTSSKSSIVYILFTWVLMASISLLALPNIWTNMKIILGTTIPLLAFALFYMSDAIFYSQFMRNKLKQANLNQRQSRLSESPARGSDSISPSDRPVRSHSGTESEATSSASRADMTLDGFSQSNIFGRHQLIHRVAKFWSKLDRIPIIWNIFILSFNLIMIVASILLNYSACYVDLKLKLPGSNLTSSEISDPRADELKSCLHQENLLFNMILVMIEVGAFFRSSYLQKVVLLTLMSFSFLALFHWINLQFDKSLVFNLAFDHVACPLLSFHPSDSNKLNLSQILQLNLLAPYTLGGTITQCDPNLMEKSYIIIGAILIGLVYVCRSTERISRLDFLLKLQAGRELQNMWNMKHCNTQLLENILPDHVATHFLEDHGASEELYAKSYDSVAVLFASIPNFSNFYSEDVNNGIECIRLLNEIIFDFDQLLESDQFKSLEKVKTISSTYMAASGLNPRDKAMPASYHLGVCCYFAFAMKRALQDINDNSYNNFEMRFGISHGSIVGGVIGAKKPVFDIWGDIVNEASRMDSTGTNGMIQVPKNSAEILASVGFKLQLRGVIPVKGKGDMETYYVIEQPSRAEMPELHKQDSIKLTGDINSAREDDNNFRGIATAVKIIEPSEIVISKIDESPDQSDKTKVLDETRLLAPHASLKRGTKISRDRKSSQSMRNLGERRFKLIGSKRAQNSYDLSGDFTFEGPMSRSSSSTAHRRGMIDQIKRQTSISKDRMAGIRKSSAQLLVGPTFMTRSTDECDGLEPIGGPKSSPVGQAGEDNSLSAVFYNMVRMRKEIDSSLTRLTPPPQSNPSGPIEPRSSSNLAGSGIEMTSGIASHFPGSSSLKLHHPHHPGSLVRPRSAQASMRKSQRIKAGLFWHRSQGSKGRSEDDDRVSDKAQKEQSDQVAMVEIHE